MTSRLSYQLYKVVNYPVNWIEMMEVPGLFFTAIITTLMVWKCSCASTNKWWDKFLKGEKDANCLASSTIWRYSPPSKSCIVALSSQNGMISQSQICTSFLAYSWTAKGVYRGYLDWSVPFLARTWALLQRSRDLSVHCCTSAKFHTSLRRLQLLQC